MREQINTNGGHVSIYTLSGQDNAVGISVSSSGYQAGETLTLEQAEWLVSALQDMINNLSGGTDDSVPENDIDLVRDDIAAIRERLLSNFIVIGDTTIHVTNINDIQHVDTSYGSGDSRVRRFYLWVNYGTEKGSLFIGIPDSDESDNSYYEYACKLFGHKPYEVKQYGE